MAYTILATWDFRGGDSSATKRASRIGSYTFTENGTPTYDTNGVTFNAGGEGLYLPAIPSELRLTQPFWAMCNFRAVAEPDTNGDIFGWQHNNTGADPYVSLIAAFTPSYGLAVRGNNNGTFYTANAGSPAVVDTDYSFTIRKTSTSANLYDGGTSIASSAQTLNPTYDTTAQFAIGSPENVTRNVNIRVAWLLIGTGDIQTSEMTTIQADPDAYIYPASSGPSTAATLGINKGFIR